MDSKKSFLNVSCQGHWLQRFLISMSIFSFTMLVRSPNIHWIHSWEGASFQSLAEPSITIRIFRFCIYTYHWTIRQAEFHSFFRINHTSVINSSIMLLYFSNKYGSRSSYGADPVTRVRLLDLFSGCPIFHISPF